MKQTKKKNTKQNRQFESICALKICNNYPCHSNNIHFSAAN